MGENMYVVSWSLKTKLSNLNHMTTMIEALKCQLKCEVYPTYFEGFSAYIEQLQICLEGWKPKQYISSGHLDINHPWLSQELTNRSTKDKKNTPNTLTHLQDPLLLCCVNKEAIWCHWNTVKIDWRLQWWVWRGRPSNWVVEQGGRK